MDSLSQIILECPKGNSSSSSLKTIFCAGALVDRPVAVYFALGGLEIVLCNLAGDRQQQNLDVLRVTLNPNLLGNEGILDITPIASHTC